MKLLLSTLALVFIFSGCSTKGQNYRLRNKNAQQSAIIEQQQALINILNTKLKNKNKINRRIRKTKTKTKTRTKTKTLHTPSIAPKAPKKEIKLKKVEDSNYSSNYMYPGVQKQASTHISDKKGAQTTTESKKVTSASMTKEECISMIGTDKFTKYTQMFGSESASLKRCKMLKAMKN